MNEQSFEFIVKTTITCLMLYVSYLITKPFLGIIIWSAIIAVTLNPVILYAQRRFKTSKLKTCVIFGLLSIFLIVAPIAALSISLYLEMQTIINMVSDGADLLVPSEKVSSIPIIGEQLYNFLFKTTDNIDSFIISHKTDSINFVQSAMSVLGGQFVAILSFIVSIIVATIFMIKSDSLSSFINNLAFKLAKESGLRALDVSVTTTRSVAKGIIGISFIQAILGYLGFLAVDLPYEAIWAILLFVMAIAQMSLLITIPSAIFVFLNNDLVTAILFGVFIAIHSVTDDLLKAFLLGRGVDVPMIVILIGVIGGMIAWGILGLFIGSVILAVTYKSIEMWTSKS